MVCISGGILEVMIDVSKDLWSGLIRVDGVGFCYHAWMEWAFCTRVLTYCNSLIDRDWVFQLIFLYLMNWSFFFFFFTSYQYSLRHGGAIESLNGRDQLIMTKSNMIYLRVHIWRIICVYNTYCTLISNCVQIRLYTCLRNYPDHVRLRVKWGIGLKLITYLSIDFV